MQRLNPSDALRLALLTALGLTQSACGGSTDALDDQGATGGRGASAGSGAGGASTGGSMSSTGGTTPTSTDGGSTTSTSACTNPVPLIEGVDTGFFRCDEGYEHRVEQKACPSNLPRSEPREPVARDGGAIEDECTRDTDCDGEHAFCGIAYAGFGDTYLACRNGCVTDDDCAAGQICRCGPDIGACTNVAPDEVACQTDADCEGDALCLGVEHQEPCAGSSVTFACASPSDSCSTASDCEDRGDCVETASGRECQALAVCGRPFLVDFAERTAALVSSRDWLQSESLGGLPEQHPEPNETERQTLLEHFRSIALMEHASIAAFARFSLQLLSLGAPAELIELTHTALADETRHARACFSLVERYGGRAEGPGPLDIEGALEGCNLETIVQTAILEGCAGETQAALEAKEAASACRDPQVRGILEMIARDESRHAELAFRFVQWALQTHPDLLDTVEATFQSILRAVPAQPHGSDTELDLRRFGALNAAQRAQVARRARRDVIAPSAQQLLAAARASALAGGRPTHQAAGPGDDRAQA